MEQNDIKVGMRVRVVFSKNAFYGIELPQAQISCRRNNAEGTVSGPIANTEGKGWWIQLDPPKSSTRELSFRAPQDKDPIKDIVDTRKLRAPYIASEIHAL